MQVVCYQAENEIGDFAEAYRKETEDPRLAWPKSSQVNSASGNCCLTQGGGVREEVWVSTGSVE